MVNSLKYHTYLYSINTIKNLSFSWNQLFNASFILKYINFILDSMGNMNNNMNMNFNVL